MLIVIFNEAAFSFEKGLNGQNDSSSGFHHTVKRFFLLAKYDLRAPAGGYPTPFP